MTRRIDLVFDPRNFATWSSPICGIAASAWTRAVRTHGKGAAYYKSTDWGPKCERITRACRATAINWAARADRLAQRSRAMYAMVTGREWRSIAPTIPAKAGSGECQEGSGGARRDFAMVARRSEKQRCHLRFYHFYIKATDAARKL